MPINTVLFLVGERFRTAFMKATNSHTSDSELALLHLLLLSYLPPASKTPESSFQCIKARNKGSTTGLMIAIRDPMTVHLLPRFNHSLSSCTPMLLASVGPSSIPQHRPLGRLSQWHLRRNTCHTMMPPQRHCTSSLSGSRTLEISIALLLLHLSTGDLLFHVLEEIYDHSRDNDRIEELETHTPSRPRRPWGSVLAVCPRGSG